ncbi:MAG: LLM class flavin-dependent oxidoreductase [Natronomonas sp.]|uniref:LLM class flavin-dependent oxidoreductase n=1 Tax=Natronomonas sp. TaxID=2184060 RepID=UPI0028709950|nr:LLM class flavin-dependent oxidoreductase [Natronomonas sp.]MDR9431801.1 LLM class flavin-dependent oxidoreductase [Natronomonas sp.]
MQFDWMVQCYAGAGVHRDTPMLETVERETILGGVDAAVDAGLEGLWAPDHFMLGPKAEEYEVWTLLSALSERTDDVDIGPLVGSVTYRNPALLAKMATSVDILSEGRLQLGLGAGWHEAEHQAYGFDFPDIGTRIEMLEEAVEIVKRMFTDEHPTYEGRHFRIDGALNNPKPVSEPHPPIVIGGAGPRMLRLIARHADEWNVEISARARGKPIEFKVKKFNEYLENEGRDPDDVRRSWLAHVLVRQDEAAVEEAVDKIFPLPWGEETDMNEELSDADDAREKGSMLIGTPSQLATQIERIRDLGFDRLQLMFLDFPDTRSMELFGDEVAPEFQR